MRGVALDGLPAFSRPGRVSADTTERIRHVAHELGYRLPLARPCATSRSTELVGLVIPEVSNPFYLEIVHGAEAAAEARGYGLVLTATRGCRRPEREVIAAVSERVDGLLLATTRLSDAAIRMAAKLRPLVVLNRAVADVPSVRADDPHGMWCACSTWVSWGTTASPTSQAPRPPSPTAPAGALPATSPLDSASGSVASVPSPLTSTEAESPQPSCWPDLAAL